MIPTGSYERFERDLLLKYNDYGEKDVVTFGILIADPRQSPAREFIFNYLDIFDKESENYFDFFIPGYSQYPWPDDAHKVGIRINNEDYYFSKKLFDTFCTNLVKDFKIIYSFNPMLILMSMQLGQKSTAKQIVLELDNLGTHGINRSGTLFRKVFEVAREDPRLNTLQAMFHRTYVKGNWLNAIIHGIGQDWLTELVHIHDGMKVYKIRSRI